MMMQEARNRDPFSPDDLEAILQWAGVRSVDSIAYALGRSAEEVDNAAFLIGLDTRLECPDLVWCDECATWRTSVSERTGRCRVCEMHHRTEGREAACAEALASMTPEQRALYVSTESRRQGFKPPQRIPPLAIPDGATEREAEAIKARHAAAVEEWEYRRAKLLYDATKTRLRRMREKIGANPRKTR